MSPSIINKSYQSSYLFPKSHLSSKISKNYISHYFIFFTSLFYITSSSIIDTLSFAAHSFLEHTFSYIFPCVCCIKIPLFLHYFFTIFIFTSKKRTPNTHKIFKKHFHSLRRSKIPLKTILSLRQQILPKDILNPF